MALPNAKPAFDPAAELQNWLSLEPVPPRIRDAIEALIRRALTSAGPVERSVIGNAAAQLAEARAELEQLALENRRLRDLRAIADEVIAAGVVTEEGSVAIAGEHGFVSVSRDAWGRFVYARRVLGLVR